MVNVGSIDMLFFYFSFWKPVMNESRVAKSFLINENIFCVIHSVNLVEGVSGDEMGIN